MTSSAHLMAVFDFYFGQPCSPHFAPLKMLFSAWVLCLNKFLSLFFYYFEMQYGGHGCTAFFLWFKTPTKYIFSCLHFCCLFIVSRSDARKFLSQNNARQMRPLFSGDCPHKPILLH